MRRPIAFISRALNKAELNYSAMEKEALAIVFSATKLRQYLLGVSFTLETDHRPLLTLFGENKGIPSIAAARIQRWALVLSGFDYKIKYVKGSINYADNLSRISQASVSAVSSESTFINYCSSAQLNYKQVAIETRRDPVLSKVMQSIQEGTVSGLKGEEFESFRAKGIELSVEAGCVLWGYRAVIPKKLQKQILESFHQSHLGIVKTKALVRSYIWWPRIDKDVEALIKSCQSCQSVLPSPEKSSLIPWAAADSAWQRIHVDFAGPVRGFQLLIIVDSFSKWVEVFKTKEMTSAFTISKLREMFCRFGLVDTLVSDNGTQFTSLEFKTFTSENHIKHVLTAPGHPATNGQAENFVKTLKKIFSSKFCRQR